jgi:drug/metabolite transporter (DMT)-like permease
MGHVQSVVECNVRTVYCSACSDSYLVAILITTEDPLSAVRVTHRTSHHRHAIVMLTTTMVIWGSTFIVTKGVIDSVPPFTLAFLRVAIGAAALTAAAVWRRRTSEVSPPLQVPRTTLIAMGFVGVALYYGLFNAALLYGSASQGALVQSCTPAVTALVAALWLRERMTAVQWAGVAVSIVGIIVIFAGRGEGAASTLGGLLMFAATLVWGVYTSLGRRAASADPIQLTAGITVFGALMLLPVAVVELSMSDLPRISTSAWLAITYLGVLPSGIAYLLYNAALKYVPASEAGVYVNLMPIVGLLSSLVVLGEPLSLQAVVGGCVVLSGVWLASRHEPAPEPQQEPR